MANKAFGARLFEARKAAGLTQEELGSAIGVGKGAVSSWEVGRTEPSISHLMGLAKRLGLTAEALVNDDEEARA